MRIFQNESSLWDDKVNFVDKNNVFVGYDLGKEGSELAGWFIDNKEHNDVPKDLPKVDNTILEKYSFDKNYFEHATPQNDKYGYDQFDAGGMVRFKLKRRGEKHLYLHLFNVHNGYYKHGFNMKYGEKTLMEDRI